LGEKKYKGDAGDSGGAPSLTPPPRLPLDGGWGVGSASPRAPLAYPAVRMLMILALETP